MPQTGANPQALLEHGHVRTDDAMAIVRARLSQGRSTGARIGAVEQIQEQTQEVLDGRDFVWPEIVMRNQDWQLETRLVVSSHRKVLGPLLIGFKKLSMPFVRWLHEYSQKNFTRQKQLNEALIASYEVLAMKHSQLEHEVDTLRARLAEPPEESP